MNADCYRRPNKPATTFCHTRDRITRQPVTLPELVAVDRATECHVTPVDVAGRMADYLRLECDDTDGPWLDPSAGTGRLIVAIQETLAGSVIAVEQHHALADGLRDEFPSVDVVQADFLTWATDIQFAGILINPPFRSTRHHINKALSLLAPGGVCIALVPSTYDHPSMDVLEHLGPDTFALANVRTKLISMREDYEP